MSSGVRWRLQVDQLKPAVKSADDLTAIIGDQPTGVGGQGETETSCFAFDTEPEARAAEARVRAALPIARCIVSSFTWNRPF